MHSNIVWSVDPNWFGYPQKIPSFGNTIIHQPRSGAGEIRSSAQQYPIWRIVYDLNWARGSEAQPSSLYSYMLGFFLAAGGQLSDFLYLDPNDNAVTAMPFGVGDGVTTAFQLTRTFSNGGSDIVQNLNGTPTIYANGGTPGSYSLSSTGIVTFTTAPTTGTVLTWTGNFYYRLRFDYEEMPFDQLVNAIWESKQMKLRSVILGSVL